MSRAGIILSLSAITHHAVAVFTRLFPEGGWSPLGIEEETARSYEYTWTGIVGNYVLTLFIIDGTITDPGLCAIHWAYPRGALSIRCCRLQRSW